MNETEHPDADENREREAHPEEGQGSGARDGRLENAKYFAQIAEIGGRIQDLERQLRDELIRLRGGRS